MSQYYDLDRVGPPCARKVDRLTHYRTMQERFAREQGHDVARKRLLALHRRTGPGTWRAL